MHGLLQVTVAFILSGKIFNSCVWLIPVWRVRSSSKPLFDTDILQDSLSDLKFLTRSITVDIFN